jgi:hypothetical protein
MQLQTCKEFFDICRKNDDNEKRKKIERLCGIISYSPYKDNKTIKRKANFLKAIYIKEHSNLKIINYKVFISFNDLKIKLEGKILDENPIPLEISNGILGWESISNEHNFLPEPLPLFAIPFNLIKVSFEDYDTVFLHDIGVSSNGILDGYNGGVSLSDCSFSIILIYDYSEVGNTNIYNSQFEWNKDYIIKGGCLNKK